MFNSNAQGVVSEENYPKGQEAELFALNSEFQKANAEYLDILYSVEDKLHNILNLRTPDKVDSGIPPEKSINDFVGSIREQLSTYRRQNNRLQKALDHIKKIIG